MRLKTLHWAGPMGESFDCNRKENIMKMIGYFRLEAVHQRPLLANCRPVLDLGQMRPCASYVMMPLTWALKEVDPVGQHRQSGIYVHEIHD